MSSPSNRGKLDLHLFTVEGKRVSDSNAHLRMFKIGPNLKEEEIFRGDVRIIAGELIPVTAFPQVKEIFCQITSTRFRETITPVFKILDDEVTEVMVPVLRKPEKWRPDFRRFNDLPSGFDALKDALGRSPELKVREGVGLAFFVGPNYDQVTEASDEKMRAAKLGLLNLYTKMTNMINPIGKKDNWFSFVNQILEIAQSRMIALVEDKMGDLVEAVSKRSHEFEDYEGAVSSNHFRNMPVRFGVDKDSMCSVKSSDRKGNVQLTIGRGKIKDQAGNEKSVTVLDADIDESGTLLAHLADVIRHKITDKQTDPFDVHEFIKRELREAELKAAGQTSNNIPLGYDLV